MAVRTKDQFLVFGAPLISEAEVEEVADATETAKVEVSSQVDDSEAVTTFTNCLEDPDNPNCEQFKKDNKVTASDYPSFLHISQPPTAAQMNFRDLVGFKKGKEPTRYVTNLADLSYVFAYTHSPVFVTRCQWGRRPR